MIYEKCRDILLRECEFLQEAAVMQEKIRLAVINKEWTGFEDNLNTMNEIEEKITALENEREHLFTVFYTLVKPNSTKPEPQDAKERFYAIASHLPDNQRKDLTEIYRSLKMQTIKLRMANDTFMTYLEGIKSTLKEFFDLAFPDRSGKMYTPQGTHFSHDMRSMVLNQSF